MDDHPTQSHLFSNENAPIIFPIVYGNISFSLKNIPDFCNANPDFTHKWILYVRGLDPKQDISPFVSKVVFKLHDSFTIPLRVVEKYPFEISELGWGEFEVLIKVYLNDPSAKPLQFVHFLRLYPSEDKTNLLSIPPTSPSVSVIAESYDEIVINSLSLKTKFLKLGIENICILQQLEQNSPYLIAEREEKDLLVSVKLQIEAEIEKVKEKRQSLAKLLSK